MQYPIPFSRKYVALHWPTLERRIVRSSFGDELCMHSSISWSLLAIFFFGKSDEYVFSALTIDCFSRNCIMKKKISEIKTNWIIKRENDKQPNVICGVPDYCLDKNPHFNQNSWLQVVSAEKQRFQHNGRSHCNPSQFCANTCLRWECNFRNLINISSGNAVHWRVCSTVENKIIHSASVQHIFRFK